VAAVGHDAFLKQATARLRQDLRIVGVAAGGSYATGDMDEYSDLDLVVAVEPSAYQQVLADRQRIAGTLGKLLAAVTGEHVGEPRLLICLYGGGQGLLHVDLKFVSLADAATRVEDPAVLWERDGQLSAALRNGVARYPTPDLQWIEDRFWVWVHYGAAKVGRGELFETLDMLALLRSKVLGPLALLSVGARPAGVRKLEAGAPDVSRAMEGTIATHDAPTCGAALAAAAALYRTLRDKLATPELTLRREAEAAAMAYLKDVRAAQ
jgi:predicted nucleotidyltransferase